MPPKAPNPKRVAAGRLNQRKRKGFTPEGLEKLRQTALQNKPWLKSTGPRTPEGKAKVALNAKVLQKGPRSVREARADKKELEELMREMREGQNMVSQLLGNTSVPDPGNKGA